jgi:sterol desaturase/sphingolipid hydroxylase (fatty acid hydroxylase superfamily)
VRIVESAKKEVSKQRSPAEKAGTSKRTLFRKEKLGCAALTVAILVFFFIVCLTLAALLGLLLSGLTTLLALPGLIASLTLSGLTTLLALSGLTTLLTFFFHVVCHELLLLKPRRNRAWRIYRHRFSCGKSLQGWDERLFG